MTEIVAIVRRSRAAATRKELERANCPGWTAFPVLGRGKQRGLRPAETGPGLPFLAKIMFSIVVEDDTVEPIVEALVRANQTGEFGDGRIWTVNLGKDFRISEGGQQT